jgi:hypothetical protein
MMMDKVIKIAGNLHFLNYPEKFSKNGVKILVSKGVIRYSNPTSLLPEDESVLDGAEFGPIHSIVAYAF